MRIEDSSVTQHSYGVLLKEKDLLERLQERLGKGHAQQRLQMEKDYEESFNGRFNLLNPDKWYSIYSVLTHVLKLIGLHDLGTKNTERVQLRENHVRLTDLPTGFDGFTILHLSDLHVDMNPGAIRRITGLIAPLKYDICVLTGDVRGKLYGSFD